MGNNLVVSDHVSREINDIFNKLNQFSIWMEEYSEGYSYYEVGLSEKCSERRGKISENLLWYNYIKENYHRNS